MRCGNCGREVPGNIKFCSFCGADLSSQVWGAPNGTPAVNAVKKDNRKLIAIILGAVVCTLAIILAAVLIVGSISGGAKDDGRTLQEDGNGTESGAAPAASEQADIELAQVDTSAYPAVRAYFCLRDLDGNLVDAPADLSLSVTEDGGTSQNGISAGKVTGTKYAALVMGSAMGSGQDYIRDALSGLLDEMESRGGYAVSLTTFDDTQNLANGFSTDFSDIRARLNSADPESGSVLWDALEQALLSCTGAEGQKCVIAVTGSRDTGSRTTRDNVAELVRELQIPVYVLSLEITVMSDTLDVVAPYGSSIDVSSGQDLLPRCLEILDRQEKQLSFQFSSDGRTAEQDRGLSLSLEPGQYSAQYTGQYHRTADVRQEAVTNSIIKDITASSYMEQYYQNTGYIYNGPENLLDGDSRTAWVENAPGNGIGEWIELGFDKCHAVHGIDIGNGYKKAEDLYFKNNRVMRIRLSFSDGTSHEFTLKDQLEGTERISFPEAVMTNKIRLEILEVYAGSKYTDTVITSLGVF